MNPVFRNAVFSHLLKSIRFHISKIIYDFLKLFHTILKREKRGEEVINKDRLI